MTCPESDTRPPAPKPTLSHESTKDTKQMGVAQLWFVSAGLRVLASKAPVGQCVAINVGTGGQGPT